MSGTLANQSITRGRVQVPAWGRTWIDVDLATPLALERGSHQIVTIANVSIACTVVAGGAYEGNASYRLVSGAGGWGKTLPRKSYVDDAGVRASMVLTDAAKACGESIADLPVTRLGPHYARTDDAASVVLHTLAPRSWYVDFTGVTRIGQRPTTTYSGNAPRVHVEPSARSITLATESVAGLVPGVVVDGMAPALDVEYLLEPNKLTVRVWGGSAAAVGRVGSIQAIVAPLLAPLRYAGVYEFRVVTQSGERLNLQPARASIGFDDLSNVPIRPGVAGVKAKVALGELVLVSFVDRDPSRPCVVAHAAADDAGWMPLELDLGGPLALGVARITDPVQAGPFSGVVTRGSATIKAAP